MDPIFKQLQSAVLEKTANTKPVDGQKATGNSSFQKTFEAIQANQSGSNTMNDKLLQMVDQSFGADQGPNTLDASSINVEVFGKEEAEKSKKSGKTDFASSSREVESVPGAGHVFDLLMDVNQNQNQFENLIGMISSGKSFKPQEMMAMQVGVQHLTLQTELLSRAAETMTKTPNQLLNMQIG